MSKIYVSEEEKLSLLKEIKRIIEDFEGQDILILDLNGISGLSDYVLIADFSVNIKMQSAYEQINQLTKKHNFLLPKIRSQAHHTDWKVVDAGSIICHLMKREVREFYELEKLWDKAKILSNLD